MYVSNKKTSKYFGAAKKSHDLNFIRDNSRIQHKNVPIEKANIKVIKAPKFANKAYENSLKMNNKQGRNENNIDNNFCFVFQPGQANNKSKIRLSGKRHSISSSSATSQAPKENPYKNDENKRLENGRKKDRPSISKSKLRINVKNSDIKEMSRFAPAK